MKMAVREQVNRMSAVEYFTLLAQLMKTNPPAAEDAPELARFARIGLVPGQDFDASKLNANFAKRSCNGVIQHGQHQFTQLR